MKGNIIRYYNTPINGMKRQEAFISLHNPFQNIEYAAKNVASNYYKNP